MIIAIDESGSFDSSSTKLNFFVAVHIRQRKTLYRAKKEQFERWEKGLPRTLKNAKGEIKSSSLSDQQLEDFAINVLMQHHYVGITPVSVRPSDNPSSVVNNRRSAQMIGIREGNREYAELGRLGPARTYEEFGGWFKRLSYTQYLKLELLGYCIVSSLVNTVGHSISGKYDEELTRITFKIDQDFIREPRHNVFWREILASQLWSFSQEEPLPIIDAWEKKGHPFLEKYRFKDDRLNLNGLFQKSCYFVNSHGHFEVRIADAVSTIISRCLNEGTCLRAGHLISKCVLRDGHFPQLVLSDVDLSTYRYDWEKNPRR